MISRKTIDEVRAKTDIVQLLEKHGVSMKASGNTYTALCPNPEHPERTPSFNVKRSEQTYHCFGCQIHGDVFSLMTLLEGFTFTGAVEQLAEDAGIQIIQENGAYDEDYEKKKQYLRCVGTAAHWFRRNFELLADTEPAKMNLANRDLLYVKNRPEWLKDFGMGFAPASYDALTNYLLGRGFSQDDILNAGLAKISEKTNKLIDRFRNRLLWEIRDVQGRPVGFSGRRLDDNDIPKYLNTSNTIMYKKSNILLGLDIARKQISRDKTCYIVEGAADVMAISAVGETNTVASCGTAFGDEHSSIIRRLMDDYGQATIGDFVFVFDGDSAGVNAARKVFEDIPIIHDRSYVVTLGDGDPVDIRLEKGDEYVLDRLKNHRIPITEFILQQILLGYDIKTSEGKQNFVREALIVVSKIPQNILREDYRKKVAFLAGVPLEHIGTTNYKAPKEDKYDKYPVVHNFARSDSARSFNEYNLAMHLLQFPSQVSQMIAKNPRVPLIVKDPEILQILKEALDTIYLKKDEYGNYFFTSDKFSNSPLMFHLLHAPLNTTEVEAVSYVERIFHSLEKITLIDEKNNEKAKLAEAVSISDAQGIDALAQLLEAKKRRKDNK